MKKKIGFSLIEMIIVLLLTSVLVTATMSVTTIKKKPALGYGHNSDASVCIAKEYAASFNYNSSGNMTGTPSAKCTAAINNCKLNANTDCIDTLHYAKNGASQQVIVAANRVLKAACDSGSIVACNYFVQQCAIDNKCNYTSTGSDLDYMKLQYYLLLDHTNNTIQGRQIVEGLTLPFYQAGSTNIVTAVNAVAATGNTAQHIKDLATPPSAAAVDHGSQLFTADTTWVAPAGITKVWITAVGGGGGGRSGTTYCAGGGGGGGGYSLLVPVAVTPGQSYTVDIGAGGAGATAPTAGQPTRFGGVAYANGGGAAGSSCPNYNGGAGGAAGTGSWNNGKAGAAGYYNNYCSVTCTGGAGGLSGYSGDTSGKGNGGKGGNCGAAGTAGNPGFLILQW